MTTFPNCPRPIVLRESVSAALRQENVDRLNRVCPPVSDRVHKSTLYFIFDYSRSGAARRCRVYTLFDGTLVPITHDVAAVGAFPTEDRNGVQWIKLGNPGYNRMDWVAEKLAKGLGREDLGSTGYDKIAL